MRRFKAKAYLETQQIGHISLENMPDGLKDKRFMEGIFGIQVAEDGRVWICIDGFAFIRFSPHPDGRMCT
ncbi:hypothetical protein LCGC14_2619010 [marine sediment metagenome]|uniref:Uncharacterized protein n=1 Tax=marine sediment metagenome TaxID=412755 RepID=A0A0F9AR74_9ZZZZ